MKVKIAWKVYCIVLGTAMFSISVCVCSFRSLLGVGSPIWYSILMSVVGISSIIVIGFMAERIEREINRALDKINFEGSFRQALARISALEDFRYNMMEHEYSRNNAYAAYDREEIELGKAIEMLKNMGDKEEPAEEISENPEE